MPLEIARRLTDRGTPPIVYSLRENIGSLSKYAWEIVPLPRPELGMAIRDMKSRGVGRVLLAGTVPKTLIFQPAMLDRTSQDLLEGLKSRDDHAILGAIVSALEGAGFEVEGYRDLIPDLLAPEGHFAGPKPTEEEWEDIEYGLGIAKVLLPLSFGQTVIVHRKSVVAVEAMEGTDATLLRAGSLSRGGVVVKMMRQDQDERYDLPTVGAVTLRHMARAGLRCLAVEAARTIVMEKEEFVKTADEEKIAVVGVRHCPCS